MIQYLDSENKIEKLSGNVNYPLSKFDQHTFKFYQWVMPCLVLFKGKLDVTTAGGGLDQTTTCSSDLIIRRWPSTQTLEGFSGTSAACSQTEMRNAPGKKYFDYFTGISGNDWLPVSVRK